MKTVIYLLLPSLFFVSTSCFTQTRLGKSLDSLFTFYVDSNFSGTVFLAEKGEVILNKGYGFADNETKKLNTANTLFNVASIGKQFTAYSVLLLEKKGILSTNDCLAKYIGKFGDDRDSVTIHHVLLHSSGLFNQSATLDYSTRDKFLQSVRVAGAESKPGENYRYSNAGYTMLAALVEITSGEAFELFLLKNVFEPFKMQNTGYPWESRIDKSLLATGYNNKHEALPPQPNIWGARGPGNLVTSVGDLFVWIKAFQNEKLVAPAIKNKMLFDFLPTRESYSWNKNTTSRKTRFYHKGGGRNDFENRLMWYPDDEVLIIFLINNDYNLAAQIFNKIRNIMN